MRKCCLLFILFGLFFIFYTASAEIVTPVETTYEMVYTGEPQKLTVGGRAGWYTLGGFCIKTDEISCGPVDRDHLLFSEISELGYVVPDTGDNLYRTNTGIYELYRLQFNGKSRAVLVSKSINVIKPKEVTVKATDLIKIYGDNDPEFTYTVSGLIGADTIDFTVTREEGEKAGTYSIIPVGETNQGNYIVKYENGTLIIDPKSLTITAGTSTDTYNGTPLINENYSSSGLAAGDTVRSVQISGSQTGVGSSANSIRDAVIQNGSGEDVTRSYTITYIPGQLNVTKRDLSITAGSDSKVYDGIPLTANHYTYTKLAEGDSIENVLISGSRIDVGESDNTASDAKIVRNGVDVTENYNISYIPGILSVTNAPMVIITASSDSKVYDGTPLTNESYTVSGLSANDRIENVTVSGSQVLVGELENIPFGGKIVNDAGEDVTGNYEGITYRKGSLTIIPRHLTIESDSAAKVYDGTALEQNSFTNSPLASGDSIFSVEISGQQVDAGESQNTISNAAIYNSAGDDVTSCYDVTYVTGTLTVTPKKAVVSADSKEKLYGESDPVFTAAVSGLIGSNTLAYTLSRAEGENAGSYVITPAGEPTQGNYSVIYSPGELVISPRFLTIRSDDAVKEYDGLPLTIATFTSDGLATGDMVESVSITGEITDAGSAENTIADDAVIVDANGTDVSNNYKVTYQSGILEITPAPVVIRANGQTKEYGEDDPELSITIYGLKGSDTEDVLTYAVSRQEGEDVGTYDIEVSAAEEQGNYIVSVQNGLFSITPAPAIVRAEDAQKVYGEDDPVFTAVIEGLKQGDSEDVISYQIMREPGEDTSGTYFIQPAGEKEQGNYSVSYEGAVLTILPKPVSVSASRDAYKTYGDHDPLLLDFPDFIEIRKDTQPDLSAYVTREAGENVGTYKITAAEGNFIYGNYVVTVEPSEGVLTIMPKALNNSDETEYMIEANVSPKEGIYTGNPITASITLQYYTDVVHDDLVLETDYLIDEDENGDSLTQSEVGMYKILSYSPDYVLTGDEIAAKKAADTVLNYCLYRVDTWSIVDKRPKNDFYRIGEPQEFCRKCTLPATGFPTHVQIPLSMKPDYVQYKNLNMQIQIPSLNVETEIIGVPLMNDSWAVEWIGEKAGLLSGSFLPGEGLSILAGHNTLNNAEYGTFALLSSLEKNDVIFINKNHNIQQYRVYANKLFGPNDMQKVIEAANQIDNTLLLVTCENESVEGGYLNRRVVFAEPKK